MYNKVKLTKDIIKDEKVYKKRKNGKYISYINIPAVYDIETSSFYDDNG